MKESKFLLAALGGISLLSACGGGGGGGSSAPETDVCQDVAFVSCDTESYETATTITLSGVVDESFTLDPSKTWIIDGVVQVGAGNVQLADATAVAAAKAAGVTLTVPAGMSVGATDDGVLVVTRGSKLIAQGTASAPITFSSIDEGYDGLGEWGGIVIQGFAPQYGKGNTGACFGAGTVCNVVGEGGDFVGYFGGSEVADSSGALEYVRIAEGGLIAGPNNEINGLTLQGVGSGTTLDYIHVHSNLDDGIEWFGGTVNATHVVLTSNDDDDIDYDEGYQGNIQYALVIKDQVKEAPSGSNDPRGIEANSSDADYVPQTNAALANVTIIGGPAANSSSQPGMRLRGAVQTQLYNSAVKSFDAGCVRIDDASVSGSTVASTIALTNVLGDCLEGFYEKRDANTEVNSGAETLTFDAAWAINEGVASLGSATDITAVSNGSSFAFDQTDYVGAVAPGTAEDQAWWYGWTLEGVLSPETTVETPDTSVEFVSCAVDGLSCTITGLVDSDYTLVSSVTWFLDGVVQVGEGNVELADEAAVTAAKAAGVTLTIRPGTDVRATDDGVLLVTRGSKLLADGTPDAPITFSSIDEGYDGVGEWGGIVIQGFAPQYGKGNSGACFGSGTVCNVVGEGGDFVGYFGGADTTDNSGLLRYVRVAEGGLIAGPNNEINGLTLQGVGSATKIDYIHVHSNLDDGIEWFGGNVNVTHVVLTSNDDDDIDYDEGYQGNIQYALVIKDQVKEAPTGSNDPRGIEANSSDNDYVPQTNAVLSNVTIIGGPAANNDVSEQPGMRLRGAVQTTLFNSVVDSWDTGCVRIDDAAVTGVGTVESDITLVNVLGDCTPGGFYDKRAANSETNSGAATLSFDAAWAVTEAVATVTAVAPTAIDNGSDFVFDATDYAGAVAPGTSADEAWYAGWTLDVF